MLILLHGENSFLTRRKLAEVIAQYKAKHASGLSFFSFDERSDIDEVKTAYETHAMFVEKKLIVCRDMLHVTEPRTAIVALLRAKDAKEDQDIVVVLCEDERLDAAKNKDIAWLLEKPTMVQESKAFSGERLASWIREETERLGARCEDAAARELAVRCGNDLWRLSREIEKLAAHSSVIVQRDVEALVVGGSNDASHTFPGVDALVEKNGAAAARHFSGALAQGEDWARIFGAIVFQFRNMLIARDALDRGLSPAHIQKCSGMKPFVFQKASHAAKKYSMSELMPVFSLLGELDAGLKTGRFTFAEAIDRLTLRLGDRPL
ncbi:MAG: hypothetical protein AAB581_02030 [Patescibacteria group bacterium]